MINEERIVELWSEAIKDIDSHDGETIRFARAVEREAYEAAAIECVALAERRAEKYPNHAVGNSMTFVWSQNCAAAIRALKTMP